jgi:hypothetical protein
MYTKKQVDEMLSQVEQEFNNALGSIAKNEETEVESEMETEEFEKAEVEIEETEDYQTIDELYASMEKNEIEAHYESLKKVMFEEVEEEAIEKSEKDPMDEWHKKAAEKHGDDYHDASPHGKNELARKMQAGFNKSEEVETEEIQMVKSENENLKEENEELKKSLENIEGLINKMFNTKKAPSQKAITATNYIAKSEEEDNQVDFSKMTKSEITSKLKNLDYSSLEKSDREAINEYCLNNASVNKIKHLIKE